MLVGARATLEGGMEGGGAERLCRARRQTSKLSPGQQDNTGQQDFQNTPSWIFDSSFVVCLVFFGQGCGFLSPRPPHFERERECVCVCMCVFHDLPKVPMLTFSVSTKIHLLSTFMEFCALKPNHFHFWFFSSCLYN